MKGNGIKTEVIFTYFSICFSTGISANCCYSLHDRFPKCCCSTPSVWRFHHLSFTLCTYRELVQIKDMARKSKFIIQWRRLEIPDLKAFFKGLKEYKQFP